MHHTPLTWYEQENQSYQAHFRFFPSLAYLRLFLMKDGTQRHCVLVLMASHAFTKLTRSALSSSLSNSIMETQQIVAVIKGMQHDTAFLLACVDHST
jgi:hypothetical protein